MTFIFNSFFRSGICCLANVLDYYRKSSSVLPCFLSYAKVIPSSAALSSSFFTPKKLSYVINGHFFCVVSSLYISIRKAYLFSLIILWRAAFFIIVGIWDINKYHIYICIFNLQRSKGKTSFLFEAILCAEF